jgi:mannose-1-phosphate guanylyltransferase
MVNIVKALILAGGFGTRLRPLSCSRPKILFPIMNKPLLQWFIEQLVQNDVNELILAVNYLSEALIRKSQISKHGIKILYSQDLPTKPLGTGGAVKKAQKLIGSEPFLVINGDIFTELKYLEMLKVHKEKKALATIALHKVENPSRYGVAKLAKENRIEHFVEKPSQEMVPSSLINAGVYILSPEILNTIPDDQSVSIERKIFPRIAEEGLLYGYVFDGLWTDIGKIEDFLKINKALLDIYSKEERIMGKVKIKNPVAFAKGTSVGKGSSIGPYVSLGEKVSVGETVHIKDSIVFPGAAISDFVTIEGAIIGGNAIVGKGVKIKEGCVIGDHVILKDNISIAKGVSICPGKIVSESVLKNKCII